MQLSIFSDFFVVPLSGTTTKVVRMDIKTRKSNRKRDDISVIVAEMHGVSPRYVRMVRNGERENEAILTTIMDLIEGKTALVCSVNELIPIRFTSGKRTKPLLKDRNRPESGGQLPFS